MNTIPQTIFDTAFAMRVWQLNGLPCCLLNSSVTILISSIQACSIGDFPTPKSRRVVIANLLANCQSCSLKMKPWPPLTFFTRAAQSGLSLKDSDFSTRASLIAFGPQSTTTGRWPNRKQNTSPKRRLKRKMLYIYLKHAHTIWRFDLCSSQYVIKHITHGLYHQLPPNGYKTQWSHYNVVLT